MMITFPVKFRTRQGVPTIITSIQHYMKGLSTVGKGSGGDVRSGKEIKLSLVADYMIIYIENKQNPGR